MTFNARAQRKRSLKGWAHGAAVFLFLAGCGVVFAVESPDDVVIFLESPATTYSPGTTYALPVELRRSSGSITVTALGLEIQVPADWTYAGINDGAQNPPPIQPSVGSGPGGSPSTFEFAWITPAWPVHFTPKFNVPTSQLGEVELRVRARFREADGELVTAYTTRRILPEGRTAPTLTLLGENTVYVPLNGTWQEPGYAASDTTDGNLTSAVVVEGSVDTTQLGSYTLTYRVTNSAGLTTTAQRTVIVCSDACPTLTLLGESQLTVPYGVPYVERGWSAVGPGGEDLSDQVVVTGIVDVLHPGVYTLTYTIITQDCNTIVQATRTVTVEDKPCKGLLCCAPVRPTDVSSGPPFGDLAFVLWLIVSLFLYSRILQPLLKHFAAGKGKHTCA